MKEIVMQARAKQAVRFSGRKIHSNSEMSNIDIEKIRSIKEEAISIAISSTEKIKLSTRV
jgi:predicted ATPase with chaperone activity